MSAPVDAYRTVGLKDKKSGEAKEQDVAVAKPASDYTNMDAFKQLFYLDDVAVVANQSAASTRLDGLVGMVKITTDSQNNVSPASDNAKHHNITNTNPASRPSRLSRLRTKKNGEEYAVLNDGGLNTRPDIKGMAVVCYKNALIARAIVKSAYYAYTKDNITVDAKIENSGQSLLGTEDIAGDFVFNPVPAKNSQTFESSLHVFQAPYDTAKYVKFVTTVENEEGTYDNTSSRQDVYQEYIKHPFVYGKLFLGPNPPQTVEELKAGDEAPMMMTVDDYNDLAQVPPDGTKHPVIYRDAYLSHKPGSYNYYAKGVFLTDMKIQPGSTSAIDKIKFYKIGDNGKVESSRIESYQKITAFVSFGLINPFNMEGEGYGSSIELTASYHYADETSRPDVNLTGRIDLVDINGRNLSTGIEWPDSSNTSKNVSITLRSDGTIRGPKILFFKITDPTKDMYLKLYDTTQGAPYEIRASTNKVQINKGN